MTPDHLATAVAAGLAAMVVTAVLARVRLMAPPRVLLRTNVEGDQVPAVLGGPLAIGSLVALAAVAAAGAVGWAPARNGHLDIALAVVMVVMTLAGSWDDRRGDELPRGFRGHLTALRRARVTGGVVKLAAGGVAGLVAGALLAEGSAIIVVAALVALSANLINLTDRAPGRAAKVALIVAVPLLFASPQWGVASAPVWGALLACLPLDLGGRAMLGDAGANPLGAVLGIGLAVALPPAGRLIALAGVLALNVVSERWSFSAAIEATPWLRALDRLGRS